jgi:hypothetical protein
VYTEGHEQPDLIIEGYFEEPVIAQVSLQGASADGRMLTYAIDQLWYPSFTGPTESAQPIALDWDSVPAGWEWMAVRAGGQRQRLRLAWPLRPGPSRCASEGT